MDTVLGIEPPAGKQLPCREAQLISDLMYHHAMDCGPESLAMLTDEVVRWLPPVVPVDSLAGRMVTTLLSVAADGPVIPAFRDHFHDGKIILAGLGDSVAAALEIEE